MKKNFTLIELLMVVAIVAILAGLLLTAVLSAPKKVEAAKCRSQIVTLSNAIRQFEGEYGYLPLPNGMTKDGTLSNDEYDALIAILQADVNSDAWKNLSDVNKKLNKRRVKFLDIVANESGRFVDPWDESFKVLMDADYDGKILLSSSDMIDGIVADSITKNSDNKYVFNYPLIVWSKGSDGKSDNTASKKQNKDNIYSFDTNWNDGHFISK